jgi:Protein of unknown function (DUF664)
MCLLGPLNALSSACLSLWGSDGGTGSHSDFKTAFEFPAYDGRPSEAAPDRRVGSRQRAKAKSYGSVAMADRRTPFTVSDERDTLMAFLDYLRESVILKVNGLDEASARRSTVPSGTSLLGLIKHLTSVEVG